MIVGSRIDPHAYRSGDFLPEHDAKDETRNADQSQRRAPSRSNRPTDELLSLWSGRKDCHGPHPAMIRTWRTPNNRSVRWLDPTGKRTGCSAGLSADPPDD